MSLPAAMESEMPAILVDDTKSPTPATYGPAFQQEVAEIAKYQSNRHNAYAWARNLRFLVYDDEDDEEEEMELNRGPESQGSEGDEGDGDEEGKKIQEAIVLSLATERLDGSGSGLGDESDQTVATDESVSSEPEFENEQEMLDYALAMSLEENDNSPPNDNFASAALGKEPKSTKSHPSHPRFCETCKRYPRFPSSKKATKFRVLQFRPEDLAHVKLCDHYAAVSYCWRSDDTGTSAAAEKFYRIRVQNPDGTFTERINRTPNEIIDRAVDATRAAGFRLIWIDQECLPQDDSREQELGIQAMDMVYQRAQLTIGLLESNIPEQAHLDAVASVLYWGVRREKDPKAILAQRRPGVPLQQFCLTLLEFLEMLADDLWNSRAWILQEAFSSAEDLALFIRTGPDVKFHPPPEQIWDKDGDPNWVDGSFSIWVRDVLKLTRVSRKFLMSGVVKPQEYTEAHMNSLVEQGNDAHTADWYGRAVEVLTKLDRLFPIPAATNNRHAFMFALGGANFGPRKTCNAAVALYFLRTRSNHRPADRLAILANLCDYEIRLDTAKIERCFKSLSLCLVTLAIINGDLSLLVPSVYDNFRIQAPSEGPSWALPFPEILHSINMTTLRAGYNLTLRTSNRYSLSTSGLNLPVAFWNVNRMVDLTPVKLQWQSEWRKFTCLEIEISHRSNETMEEYNARRAEVMRQMHEDHSRTDPKHRSFEDAYEWDFEPNPALGATVTRVVASNHANGIPRLQALLGRIFVDILGYLYHTGEKALANSIWHSIRLDCASAEYSSRFNWDDSNTNALPDTVEELLQNRGLISNLWPALQLDPNDRGNLSQMWVVHRIMKYGFLWAGSYTNSWSTTPNQKPSSASPHPPPKPRRHILQSQTEQQLMAFEIKKHIHEIERKDAEAADGGVTLGLSVAVMYKVGLGELSWEREARAREMVAAFDIDGPCLVATSFDSDMERLPRPSIRSMAAAWVVQPCTFDERDVLDEERGTLGLTLTSSWDTLEKDEADLILDSVPDAEPQRQVPLDKGKGKMKESASENDSSPNIGRQCERFKVVGRVMGVWEIMEEPTNQYTFV